MKSIRFKNRFLLSFLILLGVLNLHAQTSKTKKQYIYLTFDDGPLSGSENIDSVFLQEKIKTTVFLVGEHVLANKNMENYFRYYEANPYIEEANHSYTHANNHYELFYSDVKKSTDDILKNQTFLKIQDKIVRLPGRNIWRIDGKKKDDIPSGGATANSLSKLGYKVIGWDIEWQHNQSDGTPIEPVNTMYSKIVSLLNSNKTFEKNNIVILIHDEMFQKKWEKSELKQLIDLLKKNNNYIFEQIKFYPQ